MPFQSALIGAGNTIKSVVVLLSSMTPILENKGSILLGAALNLKWYLAYIGSSIGSFLPVPFLLRAGAAASGSPVQIVYNFNTGRRRRQVSATSFSVKSQRLAPVNYLGFFRKSLQDLQISLIKYKRKWRNAMNKTQIVKEGWDRREIFDFFSSVSDPFYMLTFKQDVTNLYAYTKKHGISF